MYKDYSNTVTPSQWGKGLTKLEYFMAHAPNPPSWYEPVVGEAPNIEDEEAYNKWWEMMEREKTLQWPLYWAKDQLSRYEVIQ